MHLIQAESVPQRSLEQRKRKFGVHFLYFMVIKEKLLDPSPNSLEVGISLRNEFVLD